MVEEEIEVTDLDRAIMLAPTVITIGLFLLGIAMTPSNSWGLAVIMIGAIHFAACLKRIPANPPYIGLAQVLGRRIPVKKKEGWVLVFPFLRSLIYDVILIKVVAINRDFVFSDIRARQQPKLKENEEPEAGGEIAVNIHITYVPSYRSDDAGKQLIKYINKGGLEKSQKEGRKKEETGIDDILEDLIEEDLRELGRERDWQGITFGTEKLMWRLLQKLTGKEPPRGTEAREKAMKELRIDGWSDIGDMGILIYRFNVGKVKEQGKLAEAAELKAVETEERKGQEVEVDFVRDKTKEFIDMGLSPGEAADTVQVTTGKAKKEIHTIRGVELDKVAGAAGTALAKIFGGKK